MKVWIDNGPSRQICYLLVLSVRIFNPKEKKNNE